ncbi:unnamed protein product [Adineta ricciae]|uniref:Uncharacterized protein n=1 Tax=Adineta ricciae TaxID=249248 RepID=A0A813T7J5_ADIRI|nr:unnamed protein product [Adineta ricciae]CAF1379966.1 unnamed protein product [Adineta ricciae]
MSRTNIHQRTHTRSSELEDIHWCCLPAIISFADFFPFLFLYVRLRPHRNDSSPPVNSTSQNSQTWLELYANCSYKQNSSGNYLPICDIAVEPVSTFFLAVAFLLAITLFIYNSVTMIRMLTRSQLIFRTILHLIYALLLFITAFIYTYTRDWCSNCKLFLSLCIIPILTTTGLTCNWYDDTERSHPHQQRFVQNQSIELALLRTTNSNQSSLTIPRRPPQNNTDPQLENEYNEWLEAQQHRNQ